MALLEINNLAVEVAGKPILSDFSLTIRSGEVHAVMGPNGAGKSTLCAAIMGKPGYQVTNGSVKVDGIEMLNEPTWSRALHGLHLISQYPTEVPGVMLYEAMLAAIISRNLPTTGLQERIDSEAKRIGFDRSLTKRAINVEFSGGEKKRSETLHLSLLKPKFAVIDELDSGLDIDALVACASRIQDATQEDNLGVLVITHYSRIFSQLKPDFVHVLSGGQIVMTGGPELAQELETTGYSQK